MEKILIDTDIGDDIDDVLAVCYLLLEQKTEILGITTVFHNVWEKAKLAKCLLARAGMEHIPVYTGEACPLAGIVNVKESLNYRLEDMEGFYADGSDAAGFLARTLIESTEALTLYAIGPLTNIAKLVKDYPEAIGKIKRLVIMGGAYYKHYIEWNILCDPEAASIVMESGIPIEAVGADVTWQCQLSRKQVDAIVQAENPLSRDAGA